MTAHFLVEPEEEPARPRLRFGTRQAVAAFLSGFTLPDLAALSRASRSFSELTERTLAAHALRRYVLAILLGGEAPVDRTELVRRYAREGAYWEILRLLDGR